MILSRCVSPNNDDRHIGLYGDDWHVGPYGDDD